MPAYTYTGDEGRYYPSLGLAPEPGQEYELDHNPGDGRFDPPNPDPEPAPEPEQEPVAEAVDEPAPQLADEKPAQEKTTTKAGASAAASRKAR